MMTILPLHRNLDDGTVASTNADNSKGGPSSPASQIVLQFRYPTRTEVLSLPPPHLLARTWLAVYAHAVITNRRPTGLVLRHCTLTNATWLPFFKRLRVESSNTSAGSSIVDLRLEQCRFASPQVFLQIWLQLSHWRHLQSLVVNNLDIIVQTSSTTTTANHHPNNNNNDDDDLTECWQRFIARTAPSLRQLHVAHGKSSGRPMSGGWHGLGRGWTAAHMKGWTGIPLTHLHLHHGGLGAQGLAELVEGLSRQLPCRIQVLGLAHNNLRYDSLPRLVELLRLLQGSLVDLDLAGNHFLVDNNDLGHYKNKSLPRVLAKCRPLLHLNLQDCHLSGRAVQAILASCSANLQTLNLAKNPIGPTMWPCLLQDTLPRFGKLRSLNIAGTLLDTTDDLVRQYFWCTSTLTEVVMPQGTGATVQDLVQRHVRRNIELEHVRQWLAARSSSSFHSQSPDQQDCHHATFGRTCRRLAASDDLSPLYHLLVHHGAARGHDWAAAAAAASGAASTTRGAVSGTQNPPPLLPGKHEFDELSDITMADDWSRLVEVDQLPQMDQQHESSSLEAYSLIEAGVF